MARIAIVSYFEEGHVFATFGLANKLKKAGHHVIYLGIEDMSEAIRINGFECITYLQDVFPKNFMKNEFPKIQGLSACHIIKKWASILNKLMATYAGKQIDSQLKSLCLDFIIIDSLMPEFAFVANRNKIPAAMCSVLMPHHRDAMVPPGTRLSIPNGSLVNKKHIALQWKFIRIVNNLIRLIGKGVTGQDHRKNIKSLASDSNLKLEDINFDTIFTPMVRLPHLVLCPEEFDFPRQDKSNLHYVEPLVLPNNGEEKALPELDGGKKIVFCSLGSQGFQFKNCIGFLNELIDIFLKKSDYHLVIALGNYLDPNDLHSGENISVYPWVAQAPILKACSYMINHGGLGTVKECIYYGVPMISLPFLRDQFGNAARVSYHGIGLSEKLKGMTNKKLTSLIQRMETEPGLRENARALSKVFQKQESENTSVKLIEAFMSDHGYESVESPAKPPKKIYEIELAAG